MNLPVEPMSSLLKGRHSLSSCYQSVLVNFRSFASQICMSVNIVVNLYRLILAALIAACLLFHLAILWESRKEIAAGYGDFIIFYTGAQIINDGKSKELFKVETQNVYQASFDVPQLEWPLPFNHAPYELFLFMPLAYLSYPAAHAIWSGMNLIFLIIILQILLPYVQSQHNFFIAGALFAWFPTMETLRLGQDSIMSTLLLLAVFLNLKRQREGWAGFFLALGLYKPQLVLPMAGALMVARRWRTLTAFSITGLMLSAISLTVVGWEGVFDLLTILNSMNNYSFIVRPALMPNVRGVTFVVFEGLGLVHPSGSIIVVTSAGLYLLCLYLWRGKMDVCDSSFDLKFSLTIITTILISFHLYAHDLFLLILPVILLIRYINFGGVIHGFLVKGLYVLLIVLFLPVIPRYLIQGSAFGWAGLPILMLCIMLAVEILIRKSTFDVRASTTGGMIIC